MDEDARTIWCGNISENVSEEILYELFLQAGPIQSVRIPKSREGRQRAFGFVTYKHECSVPYALALLEGTELFRKELKLQSRNPDRINTPQLSAARDGFHNRSQSLPVQFGNPQNSFNGLNFDSLLVLGQNMMKGSRQVGNQGNMFSSQSGTSQYLGGINRFNELAARSLQGNWSNRNHPYGHGSGSHKRQKNGRNHPKR